MAISPSWWVPLIQLKKKLILVERYQLTSPFHTLLFYFVNPPSGAWLLKMFHLVLSPSSLQMSKSLIIEDFCSSLTVFQMCDLSPSYVF